MRFLIFFFIFTLSLVLTDHLVFFFYVNPYLYSKRPEAISTENTTQIHVQRQWLEMLNKTSQASAENTILVIGSSSVVADIDESALNELAANSSTKIVKLPFMSFLAAELPMVVSKIKDKKWRGVIYLYNHFSFANEFQAQVSSMRWTFTGALNFFSLEEMIRFREDIATSVFSDLFYFLKFKNLYQYWLKGLWNKTLKDFQFPYDYPLDDLYKAPFFLSRQTPLGREDLLRRMYLDSTWNNKSIGYKGLSYFINWSSVANQKILVMPAPEPASSYKSEYIGDIPWEKVDENVKGLISNRQDIYLPRSKVQEFEVNDSLFRDHVHMNRNGRNQFTPFLWNIIKESFLPNAL